MMRAMLLASAKVTSLLGRRCKTQWSKPDTLGRDRMFAHKPLGGQHIQIGDIAKSLGAQQLLGDILRSDANRRAPGETNCGMTTALLGDTSLRNYRDRNRELALQEPPVPPSRRLETFSLSFCEDRQPG